MFVVAEPEVAEVARGLAATNVFVVSHELLILGSAKFVGDLKFCMDSRNDDFSRNHCIFDGPIHGPIEFAETLECIFALKRVDVLGVCNDVVQHFVWVHEIRIKRLLDNFRSRNLTYVGNPT